MGPGSAAHHAAKSGALRSVRGTRLPAQLTPVPPRYSLPPSGSADGENNEIRVLKREDGAVVGSFGRSGRNAGQFHQVHAMAVDAKGNVYTAEVDTGKRIQKFRLTSDALR
jgi:hypothetical protein